MSETPRTWPEYAEPTPEQLADWLTAASREERIEFAERAIHDARTAGDCFMRNHAAIEREIDYLRGRRALLDDNEGEAQAATIARTDDSSGSVGMGTREDVKGAQIGAQRIEGGRE